MEARRAFAVVAAGLVVVMLLALGYLVGSRTSPGTGAGDGTGEEVPRSLRSRRRHAEPPETAAVPSDGSGAPAAQGDGVPPGGANGRAWRELLSQQRAFSERMESAKIVTGAGEWREDMTLGERVRAIEKEAGITITWDPAVAPMAASTSPPAYWGPGVPVLGAVTYLAGMKGMSLRITRDGFRFMPFVRRSRPSNVGRYDEDPLAALVAAQYLAESDLRFFGRWTDVEDCEDTHVELAANPPLAWAPDVSNAILRAARAPMGGLCWNAGEEPAGDGLRIGRLVDVFRSWFPRATVAVGRGGLCAWLDAAAADAAAAEMRGYEAFRSRLGELKWRDDAGDYPITEVAKAVVAGSGVDSLIDPAVAKVEVRAAPSESLLDVLEREMRAKRPRFLWTWADGVFVVTGPRR